MHTLTAKDLLAAWERGLSQTSARRMITLLAEVFPELGAEQLWSLPVGQRDALILTARERLFGRQLVSLTHCPACSQTLEFELDAAAIKVPDITPPSKNLNCASDGYQLRFRLPTSRDLALAENQPNPDAAYRLLLMQCVLDARRGKRAYPAQELPSAVLVALEEAMAAVDPQANTQLDLSCPGCSHHWLASFDIASFLWRELNAWALRMIGEVHQLASRYGWCEADILAMTPTRRRLYLEQLT